MRSGVIRILFTTAFGLISTCHLMGQIDSAARDSADENFRLDITESRVVESNYERSTSVELPADRQKSGVFLRVGAVASGEKIEMLLRGVTGNVRFRASLDALRRRFERLTGTNAVRNIQ